MACNQKKKGNTWERNWANWIRDNNVDKSAKRNTLSGAGMQKSDVVNNIDINFEVKSGNQVPKKIYDFYEQSEKDGISSHNIPYVVMHRDGRKQDEFMIIMNAYDWADLWKKAQEPKTTKTENQELQWVLKSAINILKKLLKLLEK